jgi:hypothetical protein
MCWSCPGVAIRVGERGVEDAAEILDRVSRAIGFGHGITITTRGSRERDGPEPYGLVVRLLT